MSAICTVTGPLARHVAECLTDAAHVIATRSLALRGNQLHLDSAQVGVGLAHHVAYIDDSLPAVIAGRAPAQPAAAGPKAAHRDEPSLPAASTAAEWWQRSPRPSMDALTTPSCTGR
ncbi:hypothetical protein [Streptomyces sp. NPDC059489]|uniref:hypothetical protein n=1 Tax=Streptomyces sp. NPDC059489 TaxID=3346849 RepID=UPI00368F8C13